MWRMRFECRITEAKDTHSEYVILIAFPWQQWLCEHASMLCYTYMACLVLPLISVHLAYTDPFNSPACQFFHLPQPAATTTTAA